MKKIIILLALMLAVMLPAQAVDPHTAEDVRAAYEALGSAPEGTPYAEIPSVSAPHSAGSLTEEALTDAINYLNFLRWLAYLETPVGMDKNLNAICQHGAVLLAANDFVDHQPPAAEGMSGDFYRIAGFATGSSNLAGLNWMRGDVLRSALEYFVRDDGEANLPVLGHRRWVLNPTMGVTGFGLANAESGMTYAAMFAHDLSGATGTWREICWPSAGAFPAELMRTELAWSVSVNPDAYDMAASSPQIKMKELVSGKEFFFEYPAGKCAGGYFIVNDGNYGSGPCLIFQPDLEGADLAEYHQNQRWEICVSGLVGTDGKSAEINYTVEMIALFPIDPAAVEISDLELTLSAGETVRLTADVIPSWADDVSIRWRSSDESIAAVDSEGNVTALKAGSCEIIAASINGREDACSLTVTE